METVLTQQGKNQPEYGYFFACNKKKLLQDWCKWGVSSQPDCVNRLSVATGKKITISF